MGITRQTINRDSVTTQVPGDAKAIRTPTTNNYRGSMRCRQYEHGISIVVYVGGWGAMWDYVIVKAYE